MATPTQESGVSWQNDLCQFLDGIGLTETSQCLNAELVVLSRHHLERLPSELEKLVDRLLQSLENHVQAKEAGLDRSNPSQEESKLLYSKKRQRPEDVVQRMDSEQVQIRATNEEMQQRIQTFIQGKQSEVDASNRTEFLNRVDPSSADVTCARTDAREINRNIQMKFDIVNNEDGPLARSLMSSSDHVQVGTVSSAHDGSEERVRNIEQHLNVTFDPHAVPRFNLSERLKILENTLMDIEREYPKWAAVHFQQPHRTFPPPPPVTYILRPDGSTNQYIATQQPQPQPQSIPGHPHMKTTGRANSSLTRAVLEQLNRQRQQAGPSNAG
ncbi:hypothetical protein BJV82DRAFT_583322 [Fennellomyces sp. T-0311]|nr:hypothetical protein BJV82DRAFT_583322 [Fennellomyces sp. T-0311]